MHLRITLAAFLAIGSLSAMQSHEGDSDFESTAAALNNLHINEASLATKSWADMDDDEPTFPTDWALLTKPPVPAAVVAPSIAKLPNSLKSNDVGNKQRSVQPRDVISDFAERNKKKKKAWSDRQKKFEHRWPTLDERIDNACKQGNTSQVVTLLGNKIEWLTQRCPEARYARECANLTCFLDTGFQNLTVTNHSQAMRFLSMAQDCMAKGCSSKNVDKRFVDMATRFMRIAAPHIQNIKPFRDLDEQIKKVISKPYTAVRTDTKIDKDIRKNDVPTNVITDYVPAPRTPLDQNRTHEAAKHILIPMESVSATTSGASEMSGQGEQQKRHVSQVPSHVVKKRQAPKGVDERIIKLQCTNWKSLSKKDLPLFERIASGEVTVHNEVKIAVCQALGKYYNNPDLADGRDIGRAKACMNQAIAAGGTHVMADMIVLCFEQGWRDETKQLCQKLAQHKDPGLKYFATAYQSITDLMADEENQWAGNALTAFKEIEQLHGWHFSMAGLANALPESFYELMRSRLNSWQQKITQPKLPNEVSTSDGNDSSIGAAVDWLYLMARVHLEGTRESLQRHYPCAIGWMKAAAAQGHWSACAYLGSLVNQKFVMPDERMKYFYAAMNGVDERSNSDSDYIYEVCEKYALTGDIGWITRVLYAYNEYDRKNPGQKTLEQLLAKWRDRFPSIVIPDGYRMTCLPEVYEGLMSSLEGLASSDWIARALRYGLAVAHLRGKILSDTPQNNMPLFESIREMTKKIDEDYRTHPTLKSVLAAGYSILGVGSLRAKRSPQDTLSHFERSIELGGLYEKIMYARCTLEGAVPGDQAKAVAILQNIAEGNSMYRMTALDSLIKHYEGKQDWANALSCLQNALTWAQGNNADRETIDKLRTREGIFQKRCQEHRRDLVQRMKGRLNLQTSSSSTMEPRCAESSLKVATQLFEAYTCVHAALDAAAHKPLEGLKHLKAARQKEAVADMLPENKDLLMRWCIAVCDIRTAITQGQLIDERLRSAALKALEDHMAYLEKPVDEYLKSFAPKDNDVSCPEKRFLNLYKTIRCLRSQDVTKLLPHQHELAALIDALLPGTSWPVPLVDLPIQELYSLAISSVQKGLSDMRIAYMDKIGIKPTTIMVKQ